MKSNSNDSLFCRDKRTKNQNRKASINEWYWQKRKSKIFLDKQIKGIRFHAGVNVGLSKKKQI